MKVFISTSIICFPSVHHHCLHYCLIFPSTFLLFALSHLPSSYTFLHITTVSLPSLVISFLHLLSMSISLHPPSFSSLQNLPGPCCSLMLQHLCHLNIGILDVPPQHLEGCCSSSNGASRCTVAKKVPGKHSGSEGGGEAGGGEGGTRVAGILHTLITLNTTKKASKFV